MEQRQAARQAMENWLAHPQELGQKPAKLEIAGEFDLYGLHYYTFKYKKSLLSRQWLLGVCGGFEGEGTEHCGHVFSEMEPYDPATAQEKAVEMVEHIRKYWMDRAAEEERQSLAAPFGGFVLLSSPEWDVEQFKATLKADWGIDYPAEDGKAASASDDHTTLVFEVDGMTVAASLMAFPVPNGEAEEYAHSNFMWQGAVEAARNHTAHIMLAVVDEEHPPIDRGDLYVKIVSTCLKAPNALGVYTNGTVWAPDYFIQVSKDLKDGELPLLDLVFIGLCQNENGVSGYTNGLRAFGRDELEVVDSAQTPRDIHMLLLNTAGYVIGQDVTLHDGETLGYTAQQKLPITRSEGRNVEGMSLKIQF